MNKQNFKGFGFYVMLVVVVVIVWMMLDARQGAANSYTMTEFKEALDKSEIMYIQIEQNREIPTGTLNIRLRAGGEKELFVSDVN